MPGLHQEKGKVTGKRSPVRRTSRLAKLGKLDNTTTIGIFRAAVKKVQITMMIANI